jgi:hypothetical protein
LELGERLCGLLCSRIVEVVEWESMTKDEVVIADYVVDKWVESVLMRSRLRVGGTWSFGSSVEPRYSYRFSSHREWV